MSKKETRIMKSTFEKKNKETRNKPQASIKTVNNSKKSIFKLNENSPSIKTAENNSLKNWNKNVFSPESSFRAQVCISPDSIAFSQCHNSNKMTQSTVLPSLKDVNPNLQEDLMISKLKQCQLFKELNKISGYNHAYEIKRMYLMDILYFVNDNPNAFTTKCYQDIIKMFKMNCFRTLSPALLMEEDIEETVMQSAWPYLLLVYDLFLKFLECPNFQPSEAKKYIGSEFVHSLLDLFETGDPQERERLKTVLHRIYGRLISVRAVIRKGIMNVFARFIYETDRHNGIAELLEILGSIINGFQVPLKAEHVKFLENYLLPLHKGSSLCSYHPQLAYCIIEYIRKDQRLQPVIVLHGLLKFWPKTTSSKEIMFLNELEEIIDISATEHWKGLCKHVFPQLALSANSAHFQVAERAMFFWSNANFQNLIKGNYQESLEFLFPSLFAARQHWNKNIQALAVNALKIMMDFDPALFQQCTENYREKKKREKDDQREKDYKWQKVNQMAKRNPLSRSVSSSTIAKKSST